MNNIAQCFYSAQQQVITGSVDVASDEVKMSDILTELIGELDLFFKHYRSFINSKYQFARKRTKCISMSFDELQRQFFNTRFIERFLENTELPDGELDRVFWCISAADYLVLSRLLSYAERIPHVTPLDRSLVGQEYELKSKFARYCHAVDLFNSMYRFACDLHAHVLDQITPGKHYITTKWPFDFPHVAETLLMGESFDSQYIFDGMSRSHVSSAVLIRSHIEAIAYRRDISSQMAHIPEALSTRESGDVYNKLKQLKDIIGAEQVTYLCKTYSALNYAAHHGLNFSHGEVWIFLETVKSVEGGLKTGLASMRTFHVNDTDNSFSS